MRLSGSRFTMALSALMVGAASVVFAIGGGDHLVAGAATSTSGGVSAGPSQIVVQTMDSCKSGIGGAVYELDTAGGQAVATVGTQGASQPGSVGSSSTCPEQQGDCASTSKGCLVFGAVPPGDYRLRETAIPGPNATNQDGYSPCNSGSGCQWETADVTVNPDGSIVGQVTNMPPSGRVQVFPNDPTHSQYYSGTPSDPIVFHNFGIAKPGTVNPGTGLPNPQCDNDGDADDWSTGTPGSNCQDPEASEASMCTNPTQFVTSAEGAQSSWKGANFPWQCMTNPVATPLHLQEITLSGPAQVSALSNFFVSVGGGYTPTLQSAQDPGMSVTPMNGGFSVAVDPIRTAATKHTPAGIGSGSITITPQGGGGKLVVLVSPPSANSNFIENLYHDLLGRFGAPGEIGYWSDRMTAGMPGWQVAQAFSTTPEYLGVIVDQDFMAMVGNLPDAGGRAFWVSQLAHGMSNDVIMGSLGASPSYYAQAGGTDSGFVSSLYLKVLHRTAPPGASDIQYWTSYGPFASNQAARLQVANDMSFSHEQHMFVAGGWYTKFLNRAPDLGGQTFWANQMDHGVLQQVGVSSFTNTPEYYALPAKY
jgi:hypothetical protein